LTRAVAAPTVTLRPATPADEPFLADLFADTRAPEFALLAVDESTREALVQMQYTAQTRSYAAAHPQGTCDLVRVDGEPAGRLYVDRHGSDVSLLDISLLKPYRGRGVGTRLLAALIDEARERGCQVHLQVARHNPALRLYQRLGFSVVNDGEVYLAMAYDPARPAER
jgi:ribosomal protein S18 acetylase RimI-like enzyme